MSKKRELLVEKAIEVFEREGFHATGIDRVLEAAGVAKMTLYKHFRSKEDLILAALRLWDERWRYSFRQYIEKHATDPKSRLLAIFDRLAEWFTDNKFHGCMVINASAEYSDKESAIYVAATEHKRLVEKYIRDQAQLAGAQDPKKLAAQLCLLIQGAIIMTQISPDEDPSTAALLAKETASMLLEQAIANTTP